MSPAKFLEYFDRISNDPDAIPRLRLFILDLAVRGKLVEQYPSEGAAINDTVRIGHQHGVEGSLLPCNIPNSWRFLSLRSISDQITDGEHATPPRIQEKQVPLVTAKNVRDGFMDFTTTDWVSSETATKAWKRCRPTPGDILLVCVGATTGRLCILRDQRDMVLVRSVALIRPSSTTNVDYLAVALRSPLLQSQIWKKVKVSAQPCLYINRINSLLIPIPPISEQHRIVAKVEEFMGMCDLLEKAKHDQEICHARLTAATHHCLNNGATVEGFGQYASFFLANLPRLTTRTEHIKQLRQTILNLAVRGQLVSQAPNDEPACKLLKRVVVDRARLVKEGLIKTKTRSTELPTPSDFPFALPNGWAPSNLQALCTSITDGDHLPPPKAENGIPFLVIGNVRSQTVNFAGCRHVSKQYYDALDEIRRPLKGDILYTLVGSYGIPIMITDSRPFCVQRHIGILRPSQMIDGRFLSLILESKWVFDQATNCATGIAQKTVPLAGLRKILIPLPPLPEQHRIVAKVDELMAVCNGLEVQLAASQTETSHLLKAVLHHTLNDSAGPIRSPTTSHMP